MSADHLVIVLAAGGSRRLGRPKQLLTCDGQSLLRRAVALAVQTRPHRVLVVLGAQHQRMADELVGLATQIVLNPAWAEGLASSVRAGAIAAASSAMPALILGCDQPALQGSHLSSLLRLAATATTGSAAAFYSGRLGIPAIVSSSLLQRAAGLRGDRGLRGVLNDLPAGSIAQLPAEELARDLDTLADCRQAVIDGLLDPF